MPNEDLKELYEKGMTILEISNTTGIKFSTCYRFLKKQGIKFRKVGRKEKTSQSQIKELRKSGNTYREIANKLAVSHVTVFNMLKKNSAVRAR